MAIELHEQNDSNILDVRLIGRLIHEDYERFMPEFDRLVKKHGKLRVLLEMVDLRGWEARAVWDDIKFDVKHFTDIERLAMVGDKKWEKGMSVLCKPFTMAKIRYFDRSAAAEAHAWLEQN